jgi:hypothetical protein
MAEITNQVSDLRNPASDLRSLTSGLCPPNPSAPRLPTPVRITDQVWPEGTAHVVSICCWTYNQADFIRDAIESFLMQETTFSVEICIHDDASTDGTAEIIREYERNFPNLFRTTMQMENQYSKNRFAFLFEWIAEQGGGYLALCEGDDYWIGRDNLQKRFEMLTHNPGSVFCGARCFVREEPSRHPYRIEPDLPSSLASKMSTADYLLGKSFMRMPTRLVRSEACSDFFRWSLGKELGTGDWSMFMFMGWKSSIAGAPMLFIDEPLAVYREQSGGVWSGTAQSARDKRSFQDMVWVERLFENHPLHGHFVAVKKTYRERLAQSFDLPLQERFKFCIDALICNPLNWRLWICLLSCFKKACK